MKKTLKRLKDLETKLGLSMLRIVSYPEGRGRVENVEGGVPMKLFDFGSLKELKAKIKEWSKVSANDLPIKKTIVLSDNLQEQVSKAFKGVAQSLGTPSSSPVLITTDRNPVVPLTMGTPYVGNGSNKKKKAPNKKDFNGYFEVTSMVHLIKPIRSSEDHTAALKEIASLMKSKDEFTLDRLDILTDLVRAYEDKTRPKPKKESECCEDCTCKLTEEHLKGTEDATPIGRPRLSKFHLEDNQKKVINEWVVDFLKEFGEDAARRKLDLLFREGGKIAMGKWKSLGLLLDTYLDRDPKTYKRVHNTLENALAWAIKINEKTLD